MKIRTPLKVLGLFIMLGMLSLRSQAQTLLNTTGATISSNDHVIEYSIGEIAITTITATGPFVTQGLLQPYVKVANAGCGFINTVFQYFPNPVRDRVSLVGVYNWIDSYTIFAADGRLVAQAPFFNNSIDMSRFASGVYFIQLLPGCNGEYKTLKILKQ